MFVIARRYLRFDYQDDPHVQRCNLLSITGHPQLGRKTHVKYPEHLEISNDFEGQAGSQSVLVNWPFFNRIESDIRLNRQSDRFPISDRRTSSLIL